MSEMIEVKTADLIGPALDWAVAQADGQEVALICPPIIDENNRPALLLNKKRWLLSGEPAKFWLPSTDWSQGGPLLDKHNIIFDVKCHALPPHNRIYAYRLGMPEAAMPGPGRLVAACRAIVASKLGDVVQVPAQLLEVAQ